METSVVVLSGIGAALSLYALYVKHKLSKNKNYHSVCDISDKVSCTAAMGSRYGSLFIIPNSAFGALFYAVMMLLGVFDEMKALFWLSVLAVLGSISLAYVSFFKLKITCPLCVGIYVINILLLIASSGSF
jgi:uncharacterized membrane protein